MTKFLDLDRNIDTLIRDSRFEEAESLLLKEYASMRPHRDSEEAKLLLDKLSQFYSLKGQNDRAEKYLLEAESLAATDHGISGTVYRKVQTASFYFWHLRDSQKTVAKVDELPPVDELTEEEVVAYYTALTLKGQALLDLGRIMDAENVLNSLGELIQRYRRLPYGDEMNFIESLAARGVSVARCSEILRLLVSRIRDLEYQDRAQTLLQNLLKIHRGGH